MADDPIKSIYSDEKQNLFLENDTIAQIYQAENAYNLDRSTPLSALKQMMREHYTPNTLMDNKTALAVVYRVEDQIPSFFEAIDGYDPSSKVQLLRIRVLSDPRNFWLPAAKNQDDPVISLHPMVRCDPDQVKDISVGDLVKVEFNNNKSQFSTVADVGSVLKVIKRIQRPFNEPEINKKQTRLPALVPLPLTNNTSTPKKPMKTSSKGIDFLAAVEAFIPHPYKDSSGIWTVGVGSVIDKTFGTVANRRRRLYEKYVIQNLGNARLGKQLANDDKKALAYYRRTKTPLITRAQADEIKRLDLKKFEKIVNNKFPNTPLKQNQFDALVSFAYNSGGIWNRLANPIKRDPNNKEAVKKAFTDPRNTTSKNPRTGVRKKLKGLANRRAKEARLFNQGIYKNIKVKYTFNGVVYYGNRPYRGA